MSPAASRQFVALMNQYVEKLHLRDTHFETVHGLDAPGQHSSAYDLAVLSRAIIHGEPDVYHMYSQKSLTWNGITQQNRNGLLWDKTMNVDGLKTGHTSGAGFNLIASAVDGQRRLIAVVMGADSPKGREQQAAKLLHWGQQNFDTVQVLQKGQKVGTERIWYGDKEQIKLGTDQDFWLALPKAEVSRIKAKYVLDKKDLEAPIAANQRVGEISLYDGDKVVGHYPLVTLESINKGGVFSRMSDYLGITSCNHANRLFAGGFFSSVARAGGAPVFTAVWWRLCEFAHILRGGSPVKLTVYSYSNLSPKEAR